MTSTTSTSTARVSLRDLSEAAFRALLAHGASQGEARVAARMVLQAELRGGGGLAALRDDLAAQPWSSTPVEIVQAPEESDAPSRAVELRCKVGNRLLREAPLAVELVASGGDADTAGVHCSVVGTALLDAVLLEAARVSAAAVAVVIWTRPEAGSANEPGAGAGSAAQLFGRLRVARPDGSLGIGTGDLLPAEWPTVGGEGVVALRDVERFSGINLRWTSANDLARKRAEAAAVGVTVDATDWHTAYAASRRYLVPD